MYRYLTTKTIYLNKCTILNFKSTTDFVIGNYYKCIYLYEHDKRFLTLIYTIYVYTFGNDGEPNRWLKNDGRSRLYGPEFINHDFT